MHYMMICIRLSTIDGETENNVQKDHIVVYIYHKMCEVS